MKKTMKQKTIYLIILLLLFISSAWADKKTDKVNKLLAQWNKSNSPGCALAIIQNNKIIYKRGYGMANLEHDIPISPDSVFYVGSCAKQFVAMCIAMLAKQEKLSLDDDIHKYVVELQDYGAPMTIRQLIHHTSGLRDYLTLFSLAGIPIGYFHKDDVLELLARQKELNFPPGEESLYSNSGYFLLAIIVERVSGKTLREFAEKNIFRPLGMKNSHFHDDHTKIVKNRASGYYPAGGGKYKNFISTFDCVGSGGLFTSVEDLFLWDQNFYHHKVGGQDLINLIQTPGELNSGEKLEYAFGLKVLPYKGLKTISHGGALGGYRAHMIRFPEQTFSVICLANLSTLNAKKLCEQVADIYLADQFIKEKEKTEDESGNKNSSVKLPERKLKEKAGAYVRTGTGEIIRVFTKNGKLYSKIRARSYLLAAMNETEFRVLKSPTIKFLKFEKSSKGNTFLLHVFEKGRELRTYMLTKLKKLNTKQLREYTGDYYSEELQRIFKLCLKEDKLYFAHKNAPQIPLRLSSKDIFFIGGLTIHFIRDKEKKISSFTLDAGRVRNLRFLKK